MVAEESPLAVGQIFWYLLNRKTSEQILTFSNLSKLLTN